MGPLFIPVRRGLGDATADLLYGRTLPAQGGISAGGYSPGPIVAPITPPSAPPTLEGLIELLTRLPSDLMSQWRTSFIQQPRETVPILETVSEVSIPTGGALTTVVSKTIPDQFVGFITHIGMNVIAPGVFPDISWSVLANNGVHPSFSAKKIFVNTLATPYPFAFEVIQGRTISIQASNANANAVLVDAVLVGWMERMDESKPYGAQPASGI